MSDQPTTDGYLAEVFPEREVLTRADLDELRTNVVAAPEPPPHDDLAPLPEFRGDGVDNLDDDMGDAGDGAAVKIEFGVGLATDMANARRLVAWFGARFRFVLVQERFLTWTGRRWEDDASGVHRFADATASRMLREATTAHKAAIENLSTAERGGGDLDAAKKALRKAENAIAWALKSQSRPRLEAMIALARYHEQVCVTVEQLDADHYKLNVENGTVDLRTGEIAPHEPADLITKLAPVRADVEASAPRWERFLADSMAGDVDRIEFLRRWVGYCLTGDTREHALLFNFGDGGNGKSVFTGVVQALMGDYAAPAPRSLLFRSRQERHPTELAMLRGLRVAICSEVEDGHAFDESKTKDLTGGDRVSARRMNEDFWSFDPTHKFLLNGNHQPRVNGTDDGIWRRIRLAPWTVSVPEEQRDSSLTAKLLQELPGILGWAVRGCLEWQRKGLGLPLAVKAATQAYRAESDPLGEFFALHCVFDPDARVSRKMLRAAYDNYCTENGIRRPLDARAFARRLREKGVVDRNIRVMTETVNGWAGVRLLDLNYERGVE